MIPAIDLVTFCDEGCNEGCDEGCDVVVDAVACVDVTGFNPGITFCGLDILLESSEACIDNSLALSIFPSP